MVNELFEKTVGVILPNAPYEEYEDSPGDNTQVRVTLPFNNLETEDSILLNVVFDTEKKLFQISDLGFCCSKLDELNRETINNNKNFIRANGLIFDFSKENNFFFVLSPAVGYEDKNIDMSALVGHYLTILLSYNR